MLHQANRPALSLIQLGLHISTGTSQLVNLTHRHALIEFKVLPTSDTKSLYCSHTWITPNPTPIKDPEHLYNHGFR